LRQSEARVIGSRNSNMKNKIIWRFLGAHIFLIFIAILVLSFFASLKLQDYYEQKISDKLTSNAFLAEDIFKEYLSSNNQEAIQLKNEYLAKKLNLRITIIDRQGKVLADSKQDSDTMENHSNRPEIIEAIRDGLGESDRFSDTLGYNMKYVAVAVEKNGQPIGLVRLALPLTEIEFQIRFIYRIVLLAGLFAVFITFIVGYFLSKSITNPISEMKDIAQRIAKGDFSKKVTIKSKDELGVLAKSLNKMADELQLKIDNLRKMDRVRTDFVANVSHELKTPLTSIKGFIETLEDGAIDDKENAKRFIAIIKKHAQRLSNIIDDLLSLSELEIGKDRMKIEKFNLKDLINEVALGFGHAFSAKKIDLKLNFEGNNFSINADKAKVEQIFVNLIDNAVKYIKENDSVIATLIEQKSNFVITVEDDGIGISQEHLSRIFERFYRVDKARSRQLGGTGLGLAIVKHIVLLHNGNIDIQSEVNRGTKITISLPKI